MIHCKLIFGYFGTTVKCITANSFVTRLNKGESGVVGEPHSQIAMLTRVPGKREKEVEEFQRKLSEQSMSEVSCSTVYNELKGEKAQETRFGMSQK